MASQGNVLVKIVSPRIVVRALMTLDKSTIVVVSTAWVVALVIIILAVFTVHNAISQKKLAEDADIAEPILPKANTSMITPRDQQIIMDRLQHQFPDIKVDNEGGATIAIRSPDGTKFHQWITAVSYVDAMAPQFRWTLKEFCVGHCNQDLMKAVLTGQKVFFSLPERDDK
jgi:hypothetical protein